MVRSRIPSREDRHITPSPYLSVVKVIGFVPAIIRRYALSEKQTLLGALRYNRLIDVFTGSVCYSLESPLRTFMAGIGEVETDDIYLGFSMTGRQYVFPVQAKGPQDPITTIQVERDLAVCASKFPTLICRPVGAQLMEADQFALFEFTLSNREVVIKDEKHYRLVRDEDLVCDNLA